MSIDLIRLPSHDAEKFSKVRHKVAPDFRRHSESIEDRGQMLRRRSLLVTANLPSRPVQQTQIISNRHWQKTFVAATLALCMSPWPRFADPLEWGTSVPHCKFAAPRTPVFGSCHLLALPPVVMANVVKFEFGRLHRLPIFDTPHRTQHQPPPSPFRITRSGHHIRPRSQHQINMIRQDRLTQQIYAEVPSLMHNGHHYRLRRLYLRCRSA